MNYCKEQDWIRANKNHYDWYYQHYKLQESGIILPVPFSKLRSFYVSDMNDRNLKPVQKWLDCYGGLFGYLLGRIDETINFEGQNWFERTWANIPKAFEKTARDIANPFGIPISLYIIGALALVILIKD